MTKNSQTDLESLYNRVFSQPKQIRTADWANLANAISESPAALTANPLLINELAYIATQHADPDVKGNALVCFHMAVKNSTGKRARTKKAIASALNAYKPTTSKDTVQQLNELWTGNTSFGVDAPTLEDGASLAARRHSIAVVLRRAGSAPSPA